MSKKDYIDAMNEIEVSENLRKETFNKIKETPKIRKYNRIYPIASLAVMCAMIMAMFLPNKTIAPMTEVKYDEAETTSVLPKVENFENLYAMLEKRAGDSYDKYYPDNFLVMEDAMIGATNSNSAPNTSGSKLESAVTDDYSKTNVQVEGVDEADIVKTDGKYIYYLANDILTITDVNDSNNIVGVANIEFETQEFYPQELFLRGNKVIVIGTKYEYKERYSLEDSFYPSSSTYTIARIYDIESVVNPKLERTVEVEGSYLSSRMIGDNIYLISNKYIYAYLCKEQEINELNEEDFKPRYLDTAVGEDVKCIDFDSIYYIPEFEDTSYLNIAAFNVANNEAANIESYLGTGSQVYSSNENLYVTKTKYDSSRFSNRYHVNTEIYKFALKDATCTFFKTGTVPGTVLNQFSMDEKDGYFRIATTDSTSWNNEDDTNNLYVLNENLEIIGKVEDLAKGERIYSVRFIGDRAYMVTFVETDPLFVIDLSDPTNPTVLGELKIPGYSKYLHPYDETHLIGFGEDTKLVNYGYGDIVTTDGMKMALFDVTDPTNPKEMYNVKIGGKGTSSELLYNHKALLFSKEKNIIAFPISITEEDYEITFRGAIVYGLSLDKGFELKGKISNSEDELSKYYYGNNVERIIYIKDTLYTLSNNLIKATDINTMETRSSLSLR